jgi:hypothetical protein
MSYRKATEKQSAFLSMSSQSQKRHPRLGRSHRLFAPAHRACEIAFRVAKRPNNLDRIKKVGQRPQTMTLEKKAFEALNAKTPENHGSPDTHS